MNQIKVSMLVLLFGLNSANAVEKNASYQKTIEAQMEKFSQKILKCHPLVAVAAPKERIDQLDFVIGPQGNVIQVDLDSSTPLDSAAQACLRKEFLSLKFSVPPGGQNFPFQGNFSFNPPVQSEWKNVSDPEEVTKAINSNSPQLSKCYQELLQDQKQVSFSGDVTIVWSVTDTGQVQNVTFPKNEIKSQSFKKCLQQKILKWEFPKAPAKTQSEIDFVFTFHDK
jgi:hypothetical protein